MCIARHKSTFPVDWSEISGSARSNCSKLAAAPEPPERKEGRRDTGGSDGSGAQKADPAVGGRRSEPIKSRWCSGMVALTDSLTPCLNQR